MKYYPTLEADTTPLKLIEYVAKGHIALLSYFCLVIPLLSYFFKSYCIAGMFGGGGGLVKHQ